MEKADGKVELLEEWLEDLDAKKERKQFEEKAERENIERERQLKFELKLHEAKVKLQSEINATEVSEQYTGTGNGVKVQAKLPKLHITKFNGTYADWPRFWNLFSETIDKSSIPPVNKFANLRELLCEKATKAIVALPHTPEGYNRAVAILKDRFGKESEIVKAFVKEILDLPNIPTANTKKIHEFYEKLAYSVQSLETLKQLDVINGTVSMVMDKLPAIRGDLVRNDGDWEKWTFVQFTDALQQWTRRNPIRDEEKPDDRQQRKRGNCYKTHQEGSEQAAKPRSCVYCGKHDHRSVECTSVKTADERKGILAKKKLCFNCTASAHRASECKSTKECKSKLEIKWRFNLSRVPWWGGQFERLIGLFKRAFYKSIGNGTLNWTELEEVVLDIEIALNNRPLTYLEDDIQQPVLTPNSMLQINPNCLPELEPYHMENKDLKRRAKFLRRCKEAMWNRWSREYVKSLRGQHRNTSSKGSTHSKVGEIVIVQDENRPRNRWKLAMGSRLITGRDNVTRGAVLKTGTGTLERAIQHLFPLELSCDRQQTYPLNPNAPEYHPDPRPRRKAAAKAEERIRKIARDED